MMALSKAEKQRNYRQRRDQDPKRRAEYIEKSRQKYKSDKEVGKIPSASTITTERQRRQVRKKWRLKTRLYRAKVKQLNMPNDDSTQNITDSTSEDETKQNQDKDHNLSPEKLTPGREIPSTDLLEENEDTQPMNTSHQKNHAKKVQRRKQSECVRKNVVLQSNIKRLEKKAEMYRKRWNRCKEKATNVSEERATPKTKTRKLLRMFSNRSTTSRKTVRKCLLFHNVLVAALRKQYKEGKRKAKETVSSVVAGDILKKYRMISRSKQELGTASHHGDRKRLFSLTHRLDRNITEFFERDDVSKLTSGIKETVTRFKVKKQKRILMNDMKRLHDQFLKENRDISISYVSFVRRRPFWVVSPTAKDRDTCACKIHENMMFMIQSLHGKKIIPDSNPQDIIAQTVCDMKEKGCMYGTCKQCKDKDIMIKYNPDEEIVWKEWKTKTEKRQVKNEIKKIVVTVKEEQQGTVDELVTLFKTAMVEFKRHIFNICNQHKHYNELRRDLKDNEVLVHIDFAENYVCQLSKEIHSMHFGASKRQISLHTGIYIIKGKEAVPFCTVSDSLQHDPVGIWAFMNPVLDDIRSKHDNVDTIHIFSDGPVTQYRQKNNFYLFSTELQRKGYTLSTWNFHESGHGKGAPDGVGAALKIAANTSVLHGKDIKNSAEFIQTIQEKSSVLLYEVKPEAVTCMSKKIPASLRPVPGTMKLHQVMSTSLGSISYRDVSCSCVKENIHPGYELKTFTLKTSIFDMPELKTCVNQSTEVKQTPNGTFAGASKFQPQLKTCVNQSTEVKQTPNGTFADASKVQHQAGPGNERIEFYEQCILSLQKCKTFKSLKEESMQINRIQSKYSISPQPVSSATMNKPVDERALSLFPDDIHNEALFPARVTADGDCLPYSGGVLAFGNEEHSVEIRVRIIVEQALFEDLYLSEGHLRKGLMCDYETNLAKTYAMFSDEYAPGAALNEATIKTVYESEVLKITRLKTYMGIWQLFALSSVLGCHMMSVYPQLGNPNVRKVLHRSITPRVINESKNGAVMWTTTRSDMRHRHWVPNHFVPVITVCKEEREHEPTPVIDMNSESVDETEEPDLDKHIDTAASSTIPDVDMNSESVDETEEPDLDKHVDTATSSTIPEVDMNSNSVDESVIIVTVGEPTYDLEDEQIEVTNYADTTGANEMDTNTTKDTTSVYNELEMLRNQVLMKRGRYSPAPNLDTTPEFDMNFKSVNEAEEPDMDKHVDTATSSTSSTTPDVDMNSNSVDESVIIVNVGEPTYDLEDEQIEVTNYADTTGANEMDTNTTKDTTSVYNELEMLRNQVLMKRGRYSPAPNLEISSVKVYETHTELLVGRVSYA